jgi:hypothetical protein
MAAYIPYLTALLDTDGPITIDGVDYDGRLFNLSNSVPAGHHAAGVAAGEAVEKLDEDGNPAANGLIGWLGLGMSNARRLLAELLPLMTSKQDAVVPANAAQTNRDLDFMIDNEATYYAEVDTELADRGLTPEQVGVVLLYTAVAGPTGSVADYIAETKSKLKTVIVDQITVRYPHCKQIYLVCREYGGWTSSGNPEPYAFAQAIAIRELVLDQVNHATTGDPDLSYAAVPWLGWTTNLYTWANGLGSDEAEGGTPGRADGLEWLESDFESGGLHQTEVGATKEANLILPEFESGPYAAPWWYADFEPTIIASHKDTDGDATVTVPSYTPTADLHQLIIISNRAAAAATAEQPVPTGHSATYALEETITFPASNRNRLSVFRGIGTGNAGTLGITFNSQNQASVQVVVIETPDLYTGGAAAALSVIESIAGSGIGVTELEIATSISINVALMIAAFANSGGFAANPQTGFSEIYDDSAGASNGLEIQTLIGHSTPAKATKAAGGTFDVAGILITLRLPPPKYVLEVVTDPEETGTITSDPAGINYPSVPDFEFYEDTEVVLTAVAIEGYRFMEWEGDIDSSSGNEVTATVDEAKTITAVFRSTKNEAGAPQGLQLALLDEPGGRVLADYSHLAYGVVAVDGPHGRESLTAGIDLVFQRAARWYRERRVLYARLAMGAEIVWDGRVEDKRIGNQGLGLTALGYWRAFMDMPYTALWSWSGTADWRPVTSDDSSGFSSERFEMDNNNRLYIAPRQDENYVNNSDGAWTYATPHNAAHAERAIVIVEFDYILDAPSDWKGYLAKASWDSFINTIEWSVASVGAILSGTISLTIAPGANRLIFGLQYDDGTPAAYTGDTGQAYFRITNLRIATATTNRINTTLGTTIAAGSRTVTPGSMANIYVGQLLRIDQGTVTGETVEVEAITATTFTATFANAHANTDTVHAIVIHADEIIQSILEDVIDVINPGQLSTNTAAIEAHSVDLLRERYEEVYPADVLRYLANIGDADGQRWEVGVREDRRLYFRPKGADAQTWYVDVTDLELEQTLEAVANSVYAIFSNDTGGQAGPRRLDPEENSLSIQRYGLTRQMAVPSSSTSRAQAALYAAAELEYRQTPPPRLAVAFDELYTAGGARVRQKWQVRPGDTIVLRNVDPTLLGANDQVLSFRVGRVTYRADDDLLQVEPETPSPSLVQLLATSSFVRNDPTDDDPYGIIQPGPGVFPAPVWLKR